MAARVNTKFVVMLSAALVLLVAGAGVAYWKFVYKSPERLMAEGDVFVHRAEEQAELVGKLTGDEAREAYETSGRKYLFASETYRRALGGRPTDIDLLLKYIDTLKHMHVETVLDARNVEGEITQRMLQATRLAPGQQDLLANYYQNMLDKKSRATNGAQAESIYKPIATATTDKLKIDPDNPVALKYQGIVQTLRLNDSMEFENQRKAREDLERAWEKLPEDRQIPSYLARWHLFEALRIYKTEEEKAKEQVAEALKLSTDLYQTYPEDMDVQLRHCEVLTSLSSKPFLDLDVPDADRLAQARPIIQNLAERLSADPHPTDAVIKTASFLKLLDHDVILFEGQRGQTTQGILNAEKLFREALKQDPLNMRLYTQLGSLLKLQMKLEDALQAYRGADNLRPVGPASSMIYTDVLQREARYQIANIELIKAESEKDVDLREQKLKLADDAVVQLEKVMDKTAPVYLLKGKIAMLRGDNAQAMQDIDKACELFETRGALNIEAVLLSARARQTQRQWGAAADRLLSVLNNFDLSENPESEIRLRSQLAEISINADNLGEAERQITRLQEIAPDSIATGMLAAGLALKKDDPQAAEAIYQQFDQLGQPQVVRNLARSYLTQGDRDRALDILTTYVQANPTDAATLTELLNTLQSPEEREVWLDKAEQGGMDPDALSRLRIGSTPVTEDNKAQIMAAMLGEGNGPTTVQAELQRSQLWQNLGEPEKSRAAFERAKAMDPDNPQIILMDIDLALRDGAISRARTLAEVVTKRNLDLAGGRFVKGQIAAAEGNLPDAIALYSEGLEERPIYDAGWRALGELYLRQTPPNLDRATEAFETAIRQKPDNVGALMGLSKIHQLRGNFGAALEPLRNAIRFNDRNPALLQQYVALETQYGDKNRVLKLRKTLAARNPKDTGNRVAMAMLYSELKQPGEAEKIIAQLEAENGGATLQTAMARASIARGQDAKDQGVSYLEDYLASRGSEATERDYLAVGRYYAASGNADQAVAMYQKAVALEDPTTRDATRALADYLFSLGRHADAAEQYESLLRHPTDDADRSRLSLRLTETYLRLNQPDRANAMLANQPASAQVDVLKAMVAQQQGDSATALKLLDSAIAADDSIALAYMQRGLLRVGTDNAGALADAQRSIDLDPTLTGAFRLKADLLLADKKISEATAAYAAALEANPADSRARITLINLYIDQRNLSDARAQVAEGMRRDPENDAWVQLDARIALTAGGNTAATLTKLQQAVEANPTPQMIRLLTSRYLQADRPQDATAMLDQHPQVVGASATLQGLRGLALAKAGNRKGAANVLARAMERAKNLDELIAVTGSANEAMGPAPTFELLKVMRNRIDPASVDLATATVLLTGKDYAKTISLLENTLATSSKLTPTTEATIEQFLALSYQETGDHDQAQKHYRVLLELRPDDLSALNNLAYMLANDLQDPAAGLPLAEKAAKLAPSNPSVLDTLGWAQHLAGQDDQARATLEKSLDIQPLAPTHLHLAHVYQALNLATKARQQCDDAIRLAERAGDTALVEKARRLLESL